MQPLLVLTYLQYQPTNNECRVHPIRYAHGFVTLCFIVVMWWALVDWCDNLPIVFRVISLALEQSYDCSSAHDDVIKWKHFPHYWPFVRGIHRSPVNFPHKGQWCGALMIYLIWTWINAWVNNCEAGDLRCYLAHYDVIVMQWCTLDVSEVTPQVISLIHVIIPGIYS